MRLWDMNDRRSNIFLIDVPKREEEKQWERDNIRKDHGWEFFKTDEIPSYRFGGGGINSKEK